MASHSTIAEYFSPNLTHALLLAWHRDDQRTSPQHPAHELALESYLKVQGCRGARTQNVKMHELAKQARRAEPQVDDADSAAPQKQMQILFTNLAQERLAQLEPGEERSIDPEMIDLIASWTTRLPTTNLESNHKLMGDKAGRMGQLSGMDGVVEGATNRLSARSRLVSCKGRSMQFSLVSFTRNIDGVPH